MYLKGFMDNGDPQVDESVTLVCPNSECPVHKAGETWHPRTFTEYQGEYPMGGLVDFYSDDAFECECGSEGEEV